MLPAVIGKHGGSIVSDRVECSGCALRGARLCRALQSVQCRQQSAIAGIRQCGREEMLYEIGSYPGLIGILRKGYLRRERLLADGRRTVLGLVQPGDVVGEMPDWPASYSLETATEAEVCLFSAPVVRRLAIENAEFRRGITADLERQYSHELTFAWLRMGLRLRERVIAFLVMAADVLPSDPQPDGSVIVQIPVGRRDWADLYNTTVESISRQMADLTSEGLVHHLKGRRYRLRNVQVLRELAGLEQSSFRSGKLKPMSAVNADRPIAMPTVSFRASDS